jgi:hypothetical protein
MPPARINGFVERMHLEDVMNWDHASVFEALARRFPDLVRHTDRSHFVAIFAPQSPQCAHLYSPTSRVYADFPLHLHPGKSSWNTDEYIKILPAIEEIKLHIGSNRRASDTLIRCKVDWRVFAERLKL